MEQSINQSDIDYVIEVLKAIGNSRATVNFESHLKTILVAIMLVLYQTGTAALHLVVSH